MLLISLHHTMSGPTVPQYQICLVVPSFGLQPVASWLSRGRALLRPRLGVLGSLAPPAGTGCLSPLGPIFFSFLWPILQAPETSFFPVKTLAPVDSAFDFKWRYINIRLRLRCEGGMMCGAGVRCRMEISLPWKQSEAVEGSSLLLYTVFPLESKKRTYVRPDLEFWT